MSKKKKRLLITKFALGALCILLVSSCIREEGAFREADIVKMNLSTDEMMNSIIRQELNKVFLIVFDTTEFVGGKIAPSIEISPGATISPAPGDSVKLDNSLSAKYTVTSESGSKKTYTVSIEPYVPFKLDFEDWYTVENKDKTKIYDMLNDPLWSNANPGVVMLYPIDTVFPTRRSEEIDAYKGKHAAHLVTVFGNKSISPKMNIPLYAGSLFSGTFQTNMNDPVSSAKFGQIHPEYAGKPIRFTGWYKYTPGKTYQKYEIPPGKTKKEVVVYPGIIDEFDIYAILFEVTKGEKGLNEYLTANDLVDIDNSAKTIVSTAFVEDRTAKSEYTKFDVKFDHKKEIDYTKHDYKLAIVFSSSKQGAFYEGAIGSDLFVDEVEIISEGIE